MTNQEVMTKQEVLNLYNGLQAVSNLSGAKWSYAIVKNISKIEQEIKALQKAYAFSDEFAAYEQKRIGLARKHAVKKAGEPQTVRIGNNEEYLIKDEKKFNVELDKLQKKHQKAVNDRKKQLADFNEILKEKIEIDLYKIDPDLIPEEITPAQLSAIMLVIK